MKTGIVEGSYMPIGYAFSSLVTSDGGLGQVKDRRRRGKRFVERDYFWLLGEPAVDEPDEELLGEQDEDGLEKESESEDIEEERGE